jgi:hypothetical protein
MSATGGWVDLVRAQQEVRDYIKLLDESVKVTTILGLGLTSSDSLARQIEIKTDLMVRLADVFDPEQVGQFRRRAFPGATNPKLTAAISLLGQLETADIGGQILTSGADFIATLHPWIQDTAAPLWRDGHRAAAVDRAASALFDTYLPRKLGRSRAKSARDTITQAFSTEPPKSDWPRLRLPGLEQGTPSWQSAHEGAMHFGQGCAEAIRNLAVHGDDDLEQAALEALASLSLLARWIERAERIEK